MQTCGGEERQGGGRNEEGGKVQRGREEKEGIQPVMILVESEGRQQA